MKHYFSMLALCAMVFSTTAFVSCTIEETGQEETREASKLTSSLLTVMTNVTEDYLQLYDIKIEAFIHNGDKEELMKSYTVTRANDETSFTFAAGTSANVLITSTPKENIQTIINETKSYAIPDRGGIRYNIKRYSQFNEVMINETHGETKSSTSYTGRQVQANLDFFKYYFSITLSDWSNSSFSAGNGEYTEPEENTPEGGA